MRYQYAGPGPHEDAELGLVRPGDVREFDEDPGRPWEPLDVKVAAEPDEDDESSSPSGASPAATGAAPAPETASSGSASPALTALSAKPEGM